MIDEVGDIVSKFDITPVAGTRKARQQSLVFSVFGLAGRGLELCALQVVGNQMFINSPVPNLGKKVTGQSISRLCRDLLFG